MPDTVMVKGCCGDVLVGEVCDCAEFAAEWAEAQTRPIYITYERTHQ